MVRVSACRPACASARGAAENSTAEFSNDDRYPTFRRPGPGGICDPHTESPIGDMNIHFGNRSAAVILAALVLAEVVSAVEATMIFAGLRTFFKLFGDAVMV